MATGTTVAADLIVPEVWADAIAPTILGKSVFVQLADTDDQLVGTPGNSVTFPKFDYIGDADELQEAVAMDLVKLSMTDSKAEIKEAGKGVALSDNATLEALGNPQSQAQSQIALSVARKIDTDLKVAAEASETYVDSKGVTKTSAPIKVATTADRFGWAAYVAGIGLLGDEYDPAEIAGIVIHSAQHASLLLDPAFQSASTFGANAVISGRGLVGQIGSVPVYVTDRVTKTGTGDATVYNALIIKRGALSLKYKRRPIVETDRDIRARVNVITTNVHYAVKRVDDRGVVVVPTKALAPVVAGAGTGA
jgi:hypothetical protein